MIITLALGIGFVMLVIADINHSMPLFAVANAWFTVAAILGGLS